MKQHITIEQLEELIPGKSIETYKNLQKEFKWFDSQMVWLNDRVFFLTIGQMIEFLEKYTGENIYTYSDSHSCWKTHIGQPEDYMFTLYWDRDKELCDCLWQSVKRILNGKNEH